MYEAIYRFFTILLMYIYRKATKVQVKIVLKTSLEYILSKIILILIYLPRYFFFLILVCLLMSVWKSLSVKFRLISVHWYVLQISWLVFIWYKFLLKVFERYFRTDVSVLIYVRCFENNSIFTEIKQNHIYVPFLLYFLNKRTNSRNTIKLVEKPLNFFFFSCWKLIDIIKFNGLPCNILQMKKRWNQDIPNTLAF